MADTIYPGNATPAQVLSGQKFSALTSYNAPGTMPNNGQVILTPQMGQNTPIPQGYHDGTGYVVPATPVASGTTNANTTQVSFQAVGYQASYYDYITVTGLTFTPKRIVAIDISGTNPAATIYDADESTVVGKAGANILCTGGGSMDMGFPVSGNAYVNATGFQLPVFQSGSYKWYAYE